MLYDWFISFDTTPACDSGRCHMPGYEYVIVCMLYGKFVTVSIYSFLLCIHNPTVSAKALCFHSAMFLKEKKGRVFT